MPSNADLTEEINKLSESLDISVDTAGLKNNELAALLSDLKAKERDAENVTQADQTSLAGDSTQGDSTQGDSTQGDEVEPVEIRELPPFSVAPGKAITSKRGMLSDGDEVQAKDLSGGEHLLKSLVLLGCSP